MRKLKKVKNETQTLFDLEYGEKHRKNSEMRKAHCRTWRMERKVKIMENEKHTKGHEIWKDTMKNMKNE